MANDLIDSINEQYEAGATDAGVGSNELSNKIAGAIARGNEIARKTYEVERAKELKAGELNRKTDQELQYGWDGKLENDSSLEIGAKTAINAASSAADWILEATSKAIDIGQGEWLDRAKVKAVRGGKDHSMSNKDFNAADNTTLQALINQYHNAEEDPMASHAIYTLRRFDGYNEDGSSKYLYKHGIAAVSASDRYRDKQMEDGFEIVDEKRFLGAEKWENTLHALSESLSERTLDEGGVLIDGERVSTDKASGIGFGGGYTEMYNRNLLGDQEESPEIFAQNRAISDALMEDADKNRIYGSNWVDALQASTAGLATNIGDFAVNKIGGMFTGGAIESQWLKDWSSAEKLNQYWGFDSVKQAKQLNEALHSLKNGDMATAGGFMAAAAPGLLAQSLPDMALLYLSWGTSLGVRGAMLASKAGGVANQMARAGKTVAQIESHIVKSASVLAKGDKALTLKYVAGIKKLQSAPGSAAILGDVIKGNAGYMAMNTLQTNRVLNDRVQAKIDAGEDPSLSAGEIGAVWFTQIPFTMLDKLAFGDTIKGTVVGKSMQDAVELMPKAMKENLAMKIATATAKIAVSSGEEAAQEFIQTWGEVLGANVGVDNKSIMDTLSDPEGLHEALLGAIGGFGAGGLTAIGGTAFRAGMDKYGNKQDDTVVSNDNPIEDPIASQDISLVDAHLNKNIPPAEPMANGTYSFAEAKQEADDLYSMGVVGMRKNMQEAASSGGNAVKYKLGTSKIIARRLKNAIDKLSNTDDETGSAQTTIDTLQEELNLFNQEIDAVFASKLKQYTQADITAMSNSELFDAFGAEPDGGIGFDSSGSEPQIDPGNMTDAQKNQVASSSTATPSVGDTTNKSDTPADIVEKAKASEKQSNVEAAIYGKTGNIVKQVAAMIAAQRAKKIRLTIEQITELDFHDIDGSFFSEYVKAKDSQYKIKDLERQEKRTIGMTNQFMVDNGYTRVDGSIVANADLINADDRARFLAKENTEWNKSEYYSHINNKSLDFVSLHDIYKTKTKTSTQLNDLKNSIEKKKLQKQSKLFNLVGEVRSVQDEIQADFDMFKRDGLKQLELSLDGTRLGGDYISNPTDAQIYDRIRGIFFTRTKNINDSSYKNGKFEINYTDVIDYMENKSKDDYEATGVIKLHNAMIKELDLLDSFDLESDNITADSGSVQNMRKKNSEKQTAEGSSKLSRADAKTKLKKIQRLIVNLEKKINSFKVDDVDKISEYQAELVDSMKLTSKTLETGAKLFFEAKNIISSNKLKSKKLQKQINAIDAEIQEREAEAEGIKNDLNAKQKGKPFKDTATGKTWDELSFFARIQVRLFGLANGIKDLLSKLRIANVHIAQLELQKNDLISEKVSIGLDTDKQKVLQKSIKDDDNGSMKNDLKRLSKKENIAEGANAEDQSRKSKDSKKLSNRERTLAALRQRAKNLEKRLSSPDYTNKLLSNQSAEVSQLPQFDTKKNQKGESSNLPFDLSMFAETAGESSSLFSKVSVKSIGNATLNASIDRGLAFMQDSGIIDANNHRTMKDMRHILTPLYPLLMDKKGNVDKNVLAAIITSADRYLKNSAQGLYKKDKQQVGKMLGLREEQVTPKIMKEFQHKTMKSYMAFELGKDILSMLDIKAKGDGDIQAYARLETAAGLLGVKYLESKHASKNQDKPLFVTTTMKVSEYNALVKESNNKTLDTKVKNIEMQFLEVPSYSKKGDKFTHRDPIDRALITKLKEDITEIEKAGILEEQEGMIVFARPAKKESGTRKIQGNSLVDMTPAIDDSLENVDQQEHNMNKGAMKYFKIFGEKFVKKSMGFIPEEDILANKNISFDTKETQISANIEKEEEYLQLIELDKKIVNEGESKTLGKEPNTMWFKGFTAYNNRINYKSFDVDPQNQKEGSRWIVTPTASHKEYSIDMIEENGQMQSDGSISYNSMTGFLFGIAQAFGKDIDKDDPLDTVTFAKEILNLPVSELVRRVQLEKGEDGKLDMDHIGHLTQALSAIEIFKKAKKNRVVSKVINGKKIYKDNGKFHATVTAEYDGITNGTILKVMQIPLGDNFAEILLKGGIVIKDTSNATLAKDGVTLQSGIDYDEFDSALITISKSKKQVKARKEAIAAAEESGDADALEKAQAMPNGVVLDTYLTGALATELDYGSVTERVEEQNEKNASYKDKKKSLDDFDLLKKNEDTDKADLMHYIPDSEEILGNKDIRDLFKFPTMIINYGGSISSIVRSVATETTHKMVDTLLQEYHGSDPIARGRANDILSRMASKLAKTEFNAKNLENLENAESKSDVDKFVYILHNKAMERIRLVPMNGEKYGGNLESSLIDLMKPAIGTAVGESIQGIFKELIDVTTDINNASHSMFRVYDQAMKQYLTAYHEKLIASGHWDRVSPDQLLKMSKDLLKYMPVFDGPGSTKRLENGIAIFDRGIESANETEYNSFKPSVRFMEKGKQSPTSMSTKTFVRKMMESYASAGVIPTHTEDAVDMAKIINKWMKDYGITPIHDAISIPGVDADIIGNDFNKNIGETSKDYSMVSAVADAMREVYNSTINPVFNITIGNIKGEDQKFNFDLSDMRNDIEKEQDKKKAKSDPKADQPVSYLGQLISMEKTAEDVWSQREEKIFSKDMKIDQLPTVLGSAYEMKAEYKKERYETELKKRISRRLDHMSAAEKGIFDTDAKVDAFIKRILYIAPGALKKMNETNKIMHNLGIINQITKALDGEC